MKDIKKHLPIGLLLLVAVMVTGVAALQYTNNSNLGQQDGWGFYLWFTPLGYLLLTWLFAGTSKLNRWHITLAGVLVYALACFFLFMPNMPPGLQWHYPIGAAGLLLVFIG